MAVDRTVIEETLKHVDDNQVEAARRLGISRTTLRAKLQSLRITGTPHD
jgi:DNA-binding NtrC family response regulator